MLRFTTFVFFVVNLKLRAEEGNTVPIYVNTKLKI